MPTLCLTCLVYTLENKPVEENKYIDIYAIFIGQLLKSGGLQKEDTFVLLTDQRTIDFIRRKIELQLMIKIFPFLFKVVIFPSPKTHLEGMMRKYTIFPFTQDIYMYCDIDIIIIKSLHNLTQNMTPKLIYVHLEKITNIRDDLYHADMPPEYIINPDTPCFSAGKYAIWGNDLLVLFYTKIHELCDYTKVYDILEQTFFNRVILENYTNMLFNTQVFNGIIVSNNGQLYDKEKTVLFDCAGDPGNGMFHYNKIVSMVTLLNCGCL